LRFIAYQRDALPGDYPGFYCRTGVDGQEHGRPVFSRRLFAADIS
jgi:hypothetical protein